MNSALSLKIVLEIPPPGAVFGLQKGSGSIYETLQKQPSAGTDLIFKLEVLVVMAKDGQPDFRGPEVQGPPGKRFVYIDIGTMAGSKDSIWTRRLKVPLSGMTWQMIEHCQKNPGWFLQANVAGTGRDGTPTCGTVKPFTGWSIAEK